VGVVIVKSALPIHSAKEYTAMPGEFERLVSNLEALQRVEPVLQKVVSTQIRMNRELADLRSKDAWARIVRSAERLKASIAAERKPDPLVTFAKAEPISLDEAQARLAKAAAAGAQAELVANLEAQIHGIALADPSLMKALRPRPSIHEIVRGGDYGAIPAAKNQRAVR
jgi:hypothetical protein